MLTLATTSHRPSPHPQTGNAQQCSRLKALMQAKSARVDDLYEDAAEVILDNLSKSGRFSRRRVGVALPPGLRNYKDDVPR